MHKPKIVIFWGKPTGPIDTENPHPYARIGKKKPVYDELFLELSKSAEVYVGVGYQNYPAPLFFSEAYKFIGVDCFEKVTSGIQADAVYDRSAKMSFPGNSKKENGKVLNASSFKLFCNNKWAFYQKFPDYCPGTRFAETKKDFIKIISGLEPEKTFVVKPFNGFKGKGIAFGNPSSLVGYPFETPVVIQDFKETLSGVPGLTKGRHDLRVAVVDGEIVWATIREPQADSLLANVAQGGAITEIEISKLPENILPVVEHLSAVFKKEYYNPLFSIDFGFEDGKPFIYEINDQIGFPLPEMKQNYLIKSLANQLLSKAMR